MRTWSNCPAFSAPVTERFQIGKPADVGLDRYDIRIGVRGEFCDLPACIRQGIAAEIGKNDAHALPGKGLCRCEADAGRSTGDDGDIAF